MNYYYVVSKPLSWRDEFTSWPFPRTFTNTRALLINKYDVLISINFHVSVNQKEMNWQFYSVSHCWLFMF